MTDLIQQIKVQDNEYYGNRTYQTIQIGDQVWMAENLNYKTADSQCK